MGVIPQVKSLLIIGGRMINDGISFAVFSVLDLVDIFLCLVYKAVDFLMEAEVKPCYCSLSSNRPMTASGKILVSGQGESRMVSLSCSKIKLDEISDTLYTRPSLVSEVSKKVKLKGGHPLINTMKIKSGTFRVHSSLVETLRGKLGGHGHPIPRWSDCDCTFCTCWTSSSCKQTLFVKAQEPKDEKAEEDVLFIHGFISSSAFWSETLFPNFSEKAKSSYRLLAIDLLGFGKSPKPTDSLYTLREHLEMIETSVLEHYKVRSFHIVAHSLGCILALALAAKYPASVKSLTLIAPPYYPVPKGEEPTQYVMRKVAPRRVWPGLAFGASIACWYEHISRTICLLICKNHRLWEFIAKLLLRNRIRTFLMEGFFCHTHNAAWHTLHNIIFGIGSKLDNYLDAARDNLTCDIAIFHGKDDELIPIECSYNVQKRIPRASVKVFEKKDHITIVIGRQKVFARELEEIWKRSSSS